MKGLQPPPKTETPSRLAARFLTLIILAGAAGMVIYAAVTNQRADVAEDLRLINLNIESPTVIDGFLINVREDEGGPDPVLLLHDADITGGLILSGLSARLGEPYHGARLDLPGFGYSSRIPVEGPGHTVAGMADRIAAVIEERFGGPVPVVGIGLGGEVGAELALTYPDLVTGVVMVDVDFWDAGSFVVGLERLPWLGKAATYTWETGGRFAIDNWSPYCDEGGWCPTAEQASIREIIVEIERTTDSLYGFRRTSDAALAPANLDDITVPMTYVWSTDGEVDQSTIDRLLEELPGLVISESDTFQAHLEDPTTIASALASLP
jgi:pimeloyl-ACP methyl ester carboxylesterase